jgi:hypothetical protein
MNDDEEVFALRARPDPDENCVVVDVDPGVGDSVDLAVDEAMALAAALVDAARVVMNGGG